MESYYPVFLDLRGKRVLVVGGGQVALRKVKSLLECGAEVLVVAPEAVPDLQQMARDGRIRLVSREYTEVDLEGASLVISATDSRDVNQRVSADAQARGVFVNVVDDPELCSFIVPSVMRRGELVVAVSTGGN
ncbi:MAG: precorrin-2 dehydrogenase/sirohydrochlorin ferrochelatase family protein, partial [Armatimonadota bacterium]